MSDRRSEQQKEKFTTSTPPLSSHYLTYAARERVNPCHIQEKARLLSQQEVFSWEGEKRRILMTVIGKAINNAIRSVRINNALLEWESRKSGKMSHIRSQLAQLWEHGSTAVTSSFVE